MKPLSQINYLNKKTIQVQKDVDMLIKQKTFTSDMFQNVVLEERKADYVTKIQNLNSKIEEKLCLQEVMQIVYKIAEIFEGEEIPYNFGVAEITNHKESNKIIELCASLSKFIKDVTTGRKYTTTINNWHLTREDAKDQLLSTINLRRSINMLVELQFIERLV
jgi:hypothetical protein